MSDQPQLFDTPDVPVPPARCPDCGSELTYVAFHVRECREACGYRWERSAQLTSNEPWPGDPF